MDDSSLVQTIDLSARGMLVRGVPDAADEAQGRFGKPLGVLYGQILARDRNDVPGRCGKLAFGHEGPVREHPGQRPACACAADPPSQRYAREGHFND